jgi:peptide/nickel transport system substrate-binding protein
VARRLRLLAAPLPALAAIVLAAVALTSCGGGSGGAQDGGTLNATYASFPGYMDPALDYDAEGWTAMSDVYIPLLTYRHAEGPEGAEVIPGLAREMPKISNGGRTYTLFLRPGLRYSDGRPVRASDFAYSVERMLRLNSGGSIFYTKIKGAERFARTKHGGIPGIRADDKTGEIAITLTAPSGTFTDELGLMFVAPVPKGTPNEDLSADPPPATGPYMITSSRPGRGWEYARNPYWAKANSKAMPDYPSGHVDRAKVTVIRNPQAQVDDVERGRYDWMQNPPPASRYAEVRERYEGTQFKERPINSTYYFWMNTTRPPFDDVRVRRAVNYAIDPAALERIYASQIAATHQVLPPEMPGYRQIDLYPHSMASARELLKEANPSDMAITVWTDTESPHDEAGEYYADLLGQLGFRTTLRKVSADTYPTVVGNSSTPDLDTGWGNWFQDYPHPNDFFQPLLAGESILPTNNSNLARIDDPSLNDKITRLAQEQLGPKQEAEYARLDREYMEQAPWAPYGTLTVGTFVSDAIDLESVIFNPTFGQYLTSFEFR